MDLFGVSLRLFALSALLATTLLLPGTSALAGKNSEPFRTEVSGGIDSAKLASLWKVTKAKCQEMGYDIENEDRELSSIFCKMDGPMGSYTILVTFDAESFTVTSKGTATRVPLMGGLLHSAKKSRKQMITALREAAED